MRARTEGVTWRTVDAQAVILDLEDSCYLRLNPAGAILWERLQNECTEDDLAEVLVSEFGIGREQADHDARQFVAAVAENNLLAEPKTT